jgi:recombination protein RecT
VERDSFDANQRNVIMEVATTNKSNGLEVLTPKTLFAKDEVRHKFQELLGKRAPAFITSVLQIVASNQLLAKADPHSIYHSAAVAATLDLPLNNNLGFAYIVPYNQKQPDGSFKQVAQFQMGYKGFIQLAQRSGQFKTISAAPVYDGQLVEQNPLTGFVFDFTKKNTDKVIGYAAYFQLLNGFEKTLFMTVEQLKAHGLKYSKTFANQKTKAHSLWENEFEVMAVKTVLKLLLSKFAPLSIDMQKAVITDQAVINDSDTEDVTYVDNSETEVDKEKERVRLLIQDAKTLDDLKKVEPHVSDDMLDLFTVKKDELTTRK